MSTIEHQISLDIELIYIKSSVTLQNFATSNLQPVLQSRAVLAILQTSNQYSLLKNILRHREVFAILIQYFIRTKFIQAQITKINEVLVEPLYQYCMHKSHWTFLSSKCVARRLCEVPGRCSSSSCSSDLYLGKRLLYTKQCVALQHETN